MPLDQLLWRKGLRDLWSRNDSAGVIAQLADGEVVQRMKRMEMQNEANILQKAEVVAWMTSKLDAVAGEKVEELKQKRTPILLEMLDAAMARAESLGAAGTQVKVVEKLARTVKYSVHEVSAALESVRAGESDGVFQVVFAYVAFIMEDAAKEVEVGKGDQVAKEALAPEADAECASYGGETGLPQARPRQDGHGCEADVFQRERQQGVAGGHAQRDVARHP